MTQKAINYAEVLCELNIDAAELSDVHHQVVCAQDLRIGHDLVADCLDELGVGRLPQQRADGVAH